MAEWIFLFFQLIHFLMEKKFPFFEKTFPKRLKKCPLHVGVALYMLRPNRDRLVNWGSVFGGDTMPFAVPCMARNSIWA